MRYELDIPASKAPDATTETTPAPTKRPRGRPPNPAPPLTVGEVRRLLAIEAASSKPNSKRTRLLLPLLASHNLEMKLALKKERERAQKTVETDESAAAETTEITRLKAEVEAQGRRIFTLLNHISELQNKKNERLHFDAGTFDKETQ